MLENLFPKREKKRLTQQFIFLDESGKPEVYSSKGVNLVQSGAASRHLVIAAIRTEDHLILQRQTLEFKTSLLNDPDLKAKFSPAYSLDAFHANHDYPEVRERFLTFIATLKIKVNVIVAEKLKCYPTLQQDPSKLYGVMAGQLLKNLCH